MRGDQLEICKNLSGKKNYEDLNQDDRSGNESSPRPQTAQGLRITGLPWLAQAAGAGSLDTLRKQLIHCHLGRIHYQQALQSESGQVAG